MTVEILFPEICNLYGDLVNVEYLRMCCPELEIVRTGLRDEPYFVKEQPTLLYMGTTTEKGQELAIAALMPYKKRLLQLVGKGAVMLFTGNALEIFGKSIECEDGRSIEGLGLHPGVAKRKMMERYNAPYLGTFRDMEIVGYKSQFAHSYIEGDKLGLFETVRGDGLHPGAECEGIRVGNLFATYLLGPFLVLNPMFTKYFLGLMGVKEPAPAFEEAAMDAYRFRLTEFKDPRQQY